MLRIRKCFEECGISQGQLVRASGWSKGLVSRVFVSGELPKDPEDRVRFRNSVMAFAESEPKILEWCETAGITTFQLLDEVDGGGPSGPRGQQQSDVEAGVIAMAGRVALNAAIDERQIFALGRTALFLLEKLRSCSIGMDELGEIELAAGRILAGGEA